MSEATLVGVLTCLLMAPDLPVLKAEKNRGTAVYKKGAVLQLSPAGPSAILSIGDTQALWGGVAIVVLGMLKEEACRSRGREGSIVSQCKWKASYMYT